MDSCSSPLLSVAVLFCSILLGFVFHGIVAVVFGAVDGVVDIVGACAAIIVIVVSIVSVVPVGWIVPEVTMGGLIISIVIILIIFIKCEEVHGSGRSDSEVGLVIE